MVTMYLGGVFSAKSDAPRDTAKKLREPSLSGSDLGDMLNDLTVFDR